MTTDGSEIGWCDNIETEQRKGEQATNDCLASPQIQNSFPTEARTVNGRKKLEKNKRER